MILSNLLQDITHIQSWRLIIILNVCPLTTHTCIELTPKSWQCLNSISLLCSLVTFMHILMCLCHAPFHSSNLPCYHFNKQWLIESLVWTSFSTMLHRGWWNGPIFCEIEWDHTTEPGTVDIQVWISYQGGVAITFLTLPHLGSSPNPPWD
jgi:hypothetical protein